jgi:hypothetical protein
MSPRLDDHFPCFGVRGIFLHLRLFGAFLSSSHHPPSVSTSPQPGSDHEYSCCPTIPFPLFRHFGSSGVLGAAQQNADYPNLTFVGLVTDWDPTNDP